MSAPALPDAELVGLTLLEDLAPTVTALPPAWEPPIIVVQRVGGDMDLDTYSDLPLLELTFYGATRPAAWDLAIRGQRAVLDAEATAVAGVLVETAEIVTGGQQVPDLDPDDRRVIVTARLSLDLRPYFA